MSGDIDEIDQFRMALFAMATANTDKH